MNTEFNLNILHNLLVRNKEDKILTPEEFRLLDNIYEELNTREHTLKAAFSMKADYKLNPVKEEN